MNIPLSDMIKSIPGVLGIRLEDELPHTVIRELGEVELRSYPPFTLARVKKTGDFEEVKEKSFIELADFIFGKNQQSEQTSMTTPVFLDRQGDDWLMSFYVPPEATHLLPENPAIWLEEKPEKVVAAYRYSGTNSLASMESARDELLWALEDAGITPASEVWWAQYDQPFSIPALKRNEALVRIEI